LADDAAAGTIGGSLLDQAEVPGIRKPIDVALHDQLVRLWD
jgi:hypothetical protein